MPHFERCVWILYEFNLQIGLYFCLFFWIEPVCVTVYSSVCLSICVSFFLCVYHVCISAYLSVCLIVCLSVFLSIIICLGLVCPFCYLSACVYPKSKLSLLVCLSVYIICLFSECIRWKYVWKILYECIWMSARNLAFSKDKFTMSQPLVLHTGYQAAWSSLSTCSNPDKK